jgi:tetratricopeptide (TPR) repeat protein
MTCCKPLLAAAIITTTLLGSCRFVRPPVTDQEALDFAKKIETSIARQDMTVLDNAIDDRLFAAQVLRKAGQQFNLTLAERARAAISELRLGHTVMADVKESGAYKLVRHYQVNGRQHLLFRLGGGADGINYHDFELARGAQGVRADDAYIYISGTNLTDAVMSKLLPGYGLANMSDDDRTNAQVKREAEQYLEGGNPEEANTYYLQASEKARKQHNFQQLHLKIARKLSDSAYLQAMEEYRTNFPQEAYAYMMLFSYYSDKKDYPATLDALDNFDRLLPNDPFLDYYRGLLYKVMDKPAQSRIALKRLHNSDPLFGGAVVELMDSYVRGGTPDSAATLIKEAERLKNITPEQLDNIKKVYPTIAPYLQ